ncbi:MAG TPA: Tm-1-like ATP-binding domain-containing protein, partial [Paracoccaceae bacterium]|nr:Tm-1-like ATP-binding domain-containing protein [Paracoccaceae bacterium]
NDVTFEDYAGDLAAWIAVARAETGAPCAWIAGHSEGGVSALDAPGKPFFDPKAREALFSALESHTRQTTTRRLQRIPHHINDAGFVAALIAAFQDLHGTPRKPRRQDRTP